ncbi:2-isopropylmalate synthase [Agarivorans albus]|uniref:2-isopropylmalate synthase n=1 Tax=Agarivorans albus MKT 106 TaxID=1331007 RepID=R9PHU9_AGAAL|nr:2-isopropylmalate synthase [Agarivorans albus]GAD00935.1 2-isopropylmalate synthase [Agarivorans albus MKT 106]
MSDLVKIFDTTLRDGEQALAASLTVKEKLQIAFALERLGVDIMEVGFPISSPGDFDSVQTIAREIKDSTVCALSRALPKDIDVAAEALKVADAFRIHTFISTSTVHVESKLKRSFDDVLEMAVNAVKHARNYTNDVEFSCEDAGRTPIDNLCRMVEAAIKAGATTVNIPDTVGYTVPSEFGGIISTLFNRVPNIDQAVISVHCHDDLGLSVANSISAVQQGARQIECTLNGIGERAGNCSLEEVAMIINTRKDQLGGLTTNIKSQEIYRASQLVSHLCNMPVQANKAIVGSNAFSHSSGIHQDGMLKNENTYEIMTPESIGLNKNSLNLTSRSGRHVIKHRMQELGYSEEDYKLDELYDSFLELADRKGQVFDYDLEALVFFNNLQDESEHYRLEYLSAQSGSDVVSTATVKLIAGEETILEASTGNGPIDAAYRCLRKITGYDIKIDDYTIEAAGGGTATAEKTDIKDALGKADIVANYQGRKYHGMGLATDIVEASAKAFVHVLNHIHRAEQVAKQKQSKLG